jgi:hypothetical protein
MSELIGRPSGYLRSGSLLKPILERCFTHFRAEIAGKMKTPSVWRGLKVFRFKAGVLANASGHRWADFGAIVEYPSVLG